MDIRRWLLAGLLAWTTTGADAATVCDAAALAPAGYGQRIAAIACSENTLWYSPFIDADGRLASTRVAEAEASRLGDGATPAWRRVVAYWRDSGLLWQMAGTPGASECAYAGEDRMQVSSCRAFVIDTPWSAVFVSYVMLRSGVPGFRPSPSHVDYVRDAYLQAEASPFRFTDPDVEKPGPGDLLCFARVPTMVFGHQGLKDFLDARPGEALNMHCEVVVATNPGGNGKLHLVGGNVLQGVTMRALHLNRNGMLWSLPRRHGGDAFCSPDNGAGCSFNRQDWTVLLKLKPLPLAPLAAQPLPPVGPAPARPRICCLKCAPDVAPSVPRC